MTALPEKPDAVAYVSDALWEAALDAALSRWTSRIIDRGTALKLEETIDHARCLILLGEVVEFVDPIEVAIEAAWYEYRARVYAALDCAPFFKTACRKHFAGLTFPVQS